MTNTAQYAVVGNPIAHSKSPVIHTEFGKLTGEDIAYDAFAITEENFPQFVKDFFHNGGSGLNITLPHKEAAFKLADQNSPRAQLAGAVNTLSVQGGKLMGENTDGPGLVRDLTTNHGVELSGKSILMLGAGGAARGALAELINTSPAKITVLNRTVTKAEAIKLAFREFFELEVGDYNLTIEQPFDLVINATSLSLGKDLPPVSPDWIHNNSCCYDMMYGDSDTVFVEWARQHGAALALDGLGMLVEQAAESFTLWRGVRPETGSVIRKLRGK